MSNTNNPSLTDKEELLNPFVIQILSTSTDRIHISKLYLRAVGIYFQRSLQDEDAIDRAAFDVSFCEQLVQSNFWKRSAANGTSDTNTHNVELTNGQSKLLFDLMFPHQIANLYDKVWTTLISTLTNTKPTPPPTTSLPQFHAYSAPNIARARACGTWKRQIERYRNHVGQIKLYSNAVKKRKIDAGVPPHLIDHIVERLAKRRRLNSNDDKARKARASRRTGGKTVPGYKYGADDDEVAIESDVSSLASERSEAVTIESFDWDQASSPQERVELYTQHLREREANKHLKKTKTVAWKKGGRIYYQERSIHGSDTDESAEDPDDRPRAITVGEAQESFARLKEDLLRKAEIASTSTSSKDETSSEEGEDKVDANSDQSDDLDKRWPTESALKCLRDCFNEEVAKLVGETDELVLNHGIGLMQMLLGWAQPLGQTDEASSEEEEVVETDAEQSALKGLQECLEEERAKLVGVTDERVLRHGIGVMEMILGWAQPLEPGKQGLVKKFSVLS